MPSSSITRPSRRSVWARRLAILAIVGGGAGFLFWQAHRAPAIPAWIVYGNGRLEADPIDISTKFAGRIAELRADEGDAVVAGQIVAVMDTRDLAQTLQKGEAQVEQARKSVDEANSTAEQARSSTLLAEQEMERAQKLLANGWTTKEVFDQRKQQLDSARALQDAADHRVTEAQNALKAAQHDAELTRVNINDNTLVAPRDGRIEYRLANVGEVLASRRQGLHHARHGLCLYGRLSADAFRRQGEDRRRFPHPARRLSGPADPGKGLLSRQPGAIHAENGGDQERSRQADVPRAGARSIPTAPTPMPAKCAAACRAWPMSRPTTPRNGLRRFRAARNEP